LRRRYPNVSGEQKDDLSVILAASLTLLALIIGFSFSMATNRYDQRKNFEEAEANAIGTELLRADHLPPADAAALAANEMGSGAGLHADEAGRNICSAARVSLSRRTIVPLAFMAQI
jgi:hypothetical protein